MNIDDILHYNNMGRKLNLLFKGLQIYKNWPTWLLFKLHFLTDRKERIIRLKSGPQFAARFDLNEPGTIDDIFIYDEYSFYRSVPDGGTIIDIGGNIGAFSIAAATFAHNLRVFTYEPSPDTFRRLSKNITLNKMENSIQAFNLAVAGEKGKRMLSSDPSNSGLSSIVFGQNEEGVKAGLVGQMVATTTLPDIMDEHNIGKCDFLKMDCEGAEYEIFEKTPDDVFLKIAAIGMEYHGDPAPLERRLRALGFDVTVRSTGAMIGLLAAKRALAF